VKYLNFYWINEILVIKINNYIKKWLD